MHLLSVIIIIIIIIIIIAKSHKVKYSSHNVCIRTAKCKAFYLLKFAVFRMESSVFW